MNTQVVSASARYQQYVQSISDAQDLVRTMADSQLAWVSLVVEGQKTALDLLQSQLVANVQSDWLQKWADAGAKLVLQATRT